MFARICQSLGDPYGNVATLEQAALKTWNDYLLGQSEAANAWGGGWKHWAAAELWRMDQTITSARSYLETRYADWSTAFSSSRHQKYSECTVHKYVNSYAVGFSRHDAMRSDGTR